MSGELQPQSARERAQIAAELREEGEPLLPAEKKLIAWSIGLGVVLLVLLALAFNATK